MNTDKSILATTVFYLGAVLGLAVVLMPMSVVLGACAGILTNTFHLITGR